jgi:hemolysin III
MEVKKFFTLGEELFNAIAHGVGALLAIAGLVLAVIRADGAVEVTSVAIFTSTAILLYTMSTLYHSFPKGITKNIFERFDHSSIYMLIAGTYTPFCLILLDGRSGLTIFFIQWTLALIGIALKSVWIERFVVLHVLIFLGMGWSIMSVINPLIDELGRGGFLLLLAGGISYSIGTIFYVFSLFKFHHGIWHLFVLGGTITHFFAIYFYVL